METRHYTYSNMAQNMTEVNDASVDLIVTSPPYPMIEMWDEIMWNQNPQIKTALEGDNGMDAFELMHQELDKVWKESYRVLKEGGIVCINIGDATRTINGHFALYTNHARILNAMISLGYSNLPNIIWRKQTNAPNKFMGSGMLPGGAYVTLEHEWILIFRKGGKRVFKNEKEKTIRRESSYFWEERNIWFSDLWDLKGVKQRIASATTRERSAAYPFAIPYRLINMYSVKGDIVLDPFVGTGTTIIAAMLSERNSVSYDIDQEFQEIINDRVSNNDLSELNQIVYDRIHAHRVFVNERAADASKSAIKHYNDNIEAAVMTGQEKEASLSYIEKIMKDSASFVVSYCPVAKECDTKSDNRKKGVKLATVGELFVQHCSYSKSDVL